MKPIRRFFLLVMSALLLIPSLLPLSGCQTVPEATPKGIVLPPTRVGENQLRLNIKSASFAEAYADSNIVCILTIGNWLKEAAGDGHGTFYEATIDKLYKGDAPKNIIIRQTADSAATAGMYPFFTYGNKILMFMYEFECDDYENAYASIGAYTTVWDVVESKSGESYLLPRSDDMGMSSGLSIKNHSYEVDLVSELRQSLYETDPFWKDKTVYYGYIYALKDVENYLATLN